MSIIWLNSVISVSTGYVKHYGIRCINRWQSDDQLCIFPHLHLPLYPFSVCCVMLSGNLTGTLTVKLSRTSELYKTLQQLSFNNELERNSCRHRGSITKVMRRTVVLRHPGSITKVMRRTVVLRHPGSITKVIRRTVILRQGLNSFFSCMCLSCQFGVLRAAGHMSWSDSSKNNSWKQDSMQ